MHPRTITTRSDKTGWRGETFNPENFAFTSLCNSTTDFVVRGCEQVLIKKLTNKQKLTANGCSLPDHGAIPLHLFASHLMAMHIAALCTTYPHNDPLSYLSELRLCNFNDTFRTIDYEVRMTIRTQLTNERQVHHLVSHNWI